MSKVENKQIKKRQGLAQLVYFTSEEQNVEIPKVVGLLQSDQICRSFATLAQR